MKGLPPSLREEREASGAIARGLSCSRTRYRLFGGRSNGGDFDQPRLYVLPPSHYCERARWALDHSGLTYTEERLAVGLHVPRARRMANATTLPILTIGREVIQGSGSILGWTGMLGAAPALEQRFEERVGVIVRQFIYAGTLGVVDPSVRDVLLDGVSGGQARLGRLMWPVTRRLMVTGMNARPALLPDLEQKLTEELDWFEDQLAGRRHLMCADVPFLVLFLGRQGSAASSSPAPPFGGLPCRRMECVVVRPGYPRVGSIRYFSPVALRS